MEEAIKRVNEWLEIDSLSWMDLKDCTDYILDLSNLGLTKLPKIPRKCLHFDCSNNKLISLPNLPNCVHLDCSNNQLTSLPDLPNCVHLDCYNNQLTSLPDLPNCKLLLCQNNQLTYMPPLPKCSYIDCSGNNLLYFPKLPNCQNIYYCDNPYLHISKYLSQKFNIIKKTHNYNRYAIVIQRSYKKYMRKKYQEIINNFLLTGPTSIVCLYIIS